MRRFLAIESFAITSPSRQPSWTDTVPASLKRRDPKIWQMAYGASARAIEDSGLAPRSIVVGTALGALDETKNFLDGVFTDGLGSPRNFIASVHNSMGGKLAMELKIPGPNLTVCDGHNSFASALITADLLDEGSFPVLACFVDERIEFLDRIRPHMTGTCKKYIASGWEDAAVAFVLSRKDETGRKVVRAFGPHPVENESGAENGLQLLVSPVNGGSMLLPLEETSTSFIRPAIAAYELLDKNTNIVAFIGSFSPSARAVAAVELHA